MAKQKMRELVEQLVVEPVPLTGPVEINLEILEKVWDYRCAIFFNKGFKEFNSEDSYRFVRYSRRGSGNCMKVTISTETANEIIKRLKLVYSPNFSNSAGTYRQEGFSELDMLPKNRKKR